VPLVLGDPVDRPHLDAADAAAAPACSHGLVLGSHSNALLAAAGMLRVLIAYRAITPSATVKDVER
jgi:hypothetical protein